MKIVSPHTAGDPMNSDKWLNCRLQDVKKELDEQGHGVSLPIISRLLKQHDYSLQANVKQVEGKQHPDRDRQFEYIQEQRDKYQAAGQPEILATPRETGLTVQAHLVTEKYETGVKVPDREMNALNIQFHALCPQWNYTIYPRQIRILINKCGKLSFYGPISQ